MPTMNQPRYGSDDDYLEVPSADYDMLAQVREATDSPSPLIRILQDPHILPTRSNNNVKKERRRPSRSPHREHKSDVVIALALAEEERQANHLKALLRSSADRLEYEIRRADEATARADFSERREREAVARATSAEAAKEEKRTESIQAEKDTRSYQVQLEVAQREVRRLQMDMQGIQREMEELQESEGRTQSALQKYQVALHEHQIEMRRRDVQTQEFLNNWFKEGKEEGYDEGYEVGLKDGRRAGVKEGLKKGRKEGIEEGREQGRNEERRSALEAFDKFLSEETNDGERSERTRRWAQSVYNPEGCSSPTEISCS
ncbi:hypothetical protein B0H34DRAFT_699808 [Crassisporium funariophilum]|nr:hypothetical protein B0H34DRAFT_699808 [Crassisporium funariophilum]